MNASEESHPSRSIHRDRNVTTISSLAFLFFSDVFIPFIMTGFIHPDSLFIRLPLPLDDDQFSNKFSKQGQR